MVAVVVLAVTCCLPGHHLERISVDKNAVAVGNSQELGGGYALIDELEARDLGPGTIIFRSGNELYLVDAPTEEGTRLGSDRRDYASDRRDYGSDPRDDGSDRVIVHDPEYAQYKLKRIFGENWTTSDSK